MKWVQKIVSRFRQKSPLDVTDFDAGKPYYYENPTDPEILLKISWVYSCVRIISQAVKRTPLRVYQGMTDNEVLDGPLVQILQRPNPHMSGKQLLEGTQTWLEIHGNAFWYLSELDGRGRPKEIYLLDSRNVRVVPDKKTLIGGYVYDVNGNLIPLDTDEVIHFKTFNPFNPYYGLGTLQAVGLALQAEMLRDEYDRAFFKNGARITGVLQAQETVSQQAFERLKKMWRKFYAGASNAHKMLLLEDGIQFKEITYSQKDMEFLSLAKFNRDRIFSAFGVPPAKVSILENANYSNSEEQDRTFWSETMAPKLADIEERLNNELSPRYGNLRVEFDPVVVEDEGQKVQEVVSLANASVPVLTPNELRERLGYDPIPGGDVLVLPNGSTAGQTQQPDNNNPDNNGPQPPDNSGDTSKGLSEGWKSVRDTFQRSRVAYLAYVRKTFTPDIKAFFNEQEKRVLDKLFRAGKMGRKYNFIPDELWDTYTEDEILKSLLTVLYITVAKAAYEKAGTFFDKDLRFDLENPKHADLIQQLGQKITRINETTRKQVAEVVAEGMRRGYSINQIAHGYEQENYKGIAGVFEQARGYRAEMIARSESADAYNLANLMAYKDVGQTHVEVIDGVDWDEDCRKANGQIWTIEQAWAKPKEHPNCTRAFAPHVDLSGLSFNEIARKEGEEWTRKLCRRLMGL